MADGQRPVRVGKRSHLRRHEAVTGDVGDRRQNGGVELPAAGCRSGVAKIALNLCQQTGPRLFMLVGGPGAISEPKPDGAGEKAALRNRHPRTRLNRARQTANGEAAVVLRDAGCGPLAAAEARGLCCDGREVPWRQQ